MVVSPTIDDKQSTKDVSVLEGKEVSLCCVANGNPSPTIIWKRMNNVAGNKKDGTTLTRLEIPAKIVLKSSHSRILSRSIRSFEISLISVTPLALRLGPVKGL